MTTLKCPHCDVEFSGLILKEAMNRRECPRCGAALPAEILESSSPSGDASEYQEAVTAEERVATFADVTTTPAADAAPPSIVRSDVGETLAVVALVVPLVVQGLALALGIQSVGINLALGWGTVIVTALILAIDAWLLGNVDLKGTDHGSPVGLFLGTLIIWIVGYPMAYFRRRHFGRPNYGPLAVLVAVFFVAAPFVQNYARFGVLGASVPTCDSREVVTMVDDLIRKSPLGPSVQSITDHREVNHITATDTRVGQCVLKTQTETIPVTYRVKMIDRKAGTFHVEVDPILTEEPPRCTDHDVVTLVERIVRDGPNGQLVKTITGHAETRYDRDKKIRYGRCRVVMQDATVDIAFRVYWVDRKTGQFQVVVDPNEPN